VVGEDDGLSVREERVELGVRHAVRVLVVGLQAHEVDDVDHADRELGQVLAQDRRRRDGLERRDVARAGQDDVRLLALVRARPAQIPIPRVQCAIASSIVRYCSAGCLPEMITLM
jgi:hypothetical protein